MSDLEEKALQFAKKAHSVQLRKYTNEPYITHPIEVAEIVKSVPHTPEMIAAALLHDTVKDTDITLVDIYEEFGRDVGELVCWLTDYSRPEDGNRETRKKIDRAFISSAPPEVKTIKLADMISNTKSIAKHDPKFWKTYQKEKIALLEVLTEGDEKLFENAKVQIMDSKP